MRPGEVITTHNRKSPTRESIILDMCLEFKPDYLTVTYDGSPGTTPEEQAEIYHKMMFLYDRVIEPRMKFRQ
jgi:hypothetical protein